MLLVPLHCTMRRESLPMQRTQAGKKHKGRHASSGRVANKLTIHLCISSEEASCGSTYLVPGKDKPIFRFGRKSSSALHRSGGVAC